MSPELRLLCADSPALLGQVLAAALDSVLGIDVVACVEDGRTAVAYIRRLQPDVALLRAHLPRLPGVDACAAIKGDQSATKVVILGDSDGGHALLAAVEAGADGFAAADRPLEELIDTVRRVHEGEMVVPRYMLGALLRRLIVRRRNADRAFQRYLGLTPRERDVLELLSEGCDHEEIGQILTISEATARTHIRNVLNKLDVRSRIEAVALAVDNGWVKPGTQMEVG